MDHVTGSSPIHGLLLGLANGIVGTVRRLMKHHDQGILVAILHHHLHLCVTLISSCTCRRWRGGSGERRLLVPAVLCTELSWLATAHGCVSPTTRWYPLFLRSLAHVERGIKDRQSAHQGGNDRW